MRQSSPSSSPALRAAFFALAAAGLLIAGCSGNGGGGPVAYNVGDPVKDSTIAATASAGSSGDTLSARQFQQVLSPRPQPGQTAQPLADSVKQKRQRAVLEQLVDITALLHEAHQRGFSVDSADVTANLDQQVAQRMQQARMRMGGDSLLKARLSKQGMTVEQMRQQMRQQMLQRMPRTQRRKQLLLTRLVDSLRSEVERTTEPPSAQEVKERSIEQAREVRLQQILFRVPPRASRQQRDSIKQQAQAVLDSAKNGTGFAALASHYSQGGLGDSSGSTGYQTRRQLSRPFARMGQSSSDIPLVQTAFALQDSGDVAEKPVRSRIGYHLLRKTGERPGEPDTTAARKQLMNQRRQDALEQAVKDLRKNVTLRVNSSLVTVDMSRPNPEDENAQGG